MLAALRLDIPAPSPIKRMMFLACGKAGTALATVAIVRIANCLFNWLLNHRIRNGVELQRNSVAQPDPQKRLSRAEGTLFHPTNSVALYIGTPIVGRPYVSRMNRTLRYRHY